MRIPAHCGHRRRGQPGFLTFVSRDRDTLRRMNARGKTVGVALAGAVALASGAYALGTQSGGGSAEAAKDSANQPTVERHVFRGPAFGLGNLADTLGVDQDKLESALRELRQDADPPDPAAIRKEIAAALGVSEADLQAAMKKLRAGGLRDCAPGGPPGRGAFLFFGPGPDGGAALAKALGIDESKVRQAFETLRQKHESEMQQRRDEFAQKLADKLGISVDKVKDALDDGPLGGPPPPGHP
jgi:biotin operon repressor